MLSDWQRGHVTPSGQRNSSSACRHSSSVSKSKLRTGYVIFGLIDGVLFMARKKAAKLTDEQLAKRVFPLDVRRQLKEALTALEEVQKTQEKRKKR
jgi:hypothetical protein